MEDFPGNSQSQQRTLREEVRDQMETQKRVTRVVEGEVVRRKKPIGRRLKELFVGDGRSVKDMVLEDIIVPGFRDVLYDALQSGMEGMIYRGDARPPRRAGRSSRGGVFGGGGNVRYDRYSSHPVGRRDDSRDRDRRGDRDISRRARAQHDFDEIILPSRVEADEVLTQLFDLLDKFEEVKVADLYEMVGLSSAYTDHQWGWTDLRGSRVARVRGGAGYLLELPDPEPLRD